MVESGQFQGRVVVLSGGGSGIGQATAVQFADSGAYVLITGRREALLQQTALRHPHIVPVVADVSQAESCNQVISRAMELWGRLDILVNNAGVFRSRSLAEVSEKTFHDLFDINVLGPTLLARAALPHLIQTQGVIINVSSSYSTKPSPGAAHYAASKAALTG